jgi:hypothetical protein
VTTIDVRVGDVLEVKSSEASGWRFCMRLTSPRKVKEARGLLDPDFQGMCRWRVMRDGVEVAK